MVRLGIFGGTFDPPHLAHLVLASEAAFQLDLDEVLWVLTEKPPHKQDRSITPLAYRLEMVKAVIDEDQLFTFSRIDIDRPPPHFAVDTIRLLREHSPGATLIYLMGADSLMNLSSWYRPDEFIKRCDGIGVMRRPDIDVNLPHLVALMPELGPKLEVIDTPLLEISATQIRNRIRKGLPFRYLLPPQVYRIIIERNLYRD